MIKIAFSFKSQGTEKIELFSQGTDGSINLRFEGLITVDHSTNIKKFQFYFLGCKVKGERT